MSWAERLHFTSYLIIFLFCSGNFVIIILQTTISFNRRLLHFTTRRQNDSHHSIFVCWLNNKIILFSFFVMHLSVLEEWFFTAWCWKRIIYFYFCIFIQIYRIALHCLLDMIIMQMLCFSAALVYNLEMKIYLQDKIRKTKCNIKLLLHGQLCRDGDHKEKLYKKKSKSTL